ncbi:NAD-dependent protein deacetylase sirtuin-1 [Cladochytrium tenue]|nr:NAD-dependent protein deacetylase sirtuin-1 [Cladochytrium tenue]
MPQGTAPADDKQSVAAVADIEGGVGAAAQLVGRVRRVLAFTGAGISTTCGVPAFRGPGGLYDTVAAAAATNGGDFPTDPQDLFDLEYFRGNPQPFYTYAKALLPPPGCQPSATHMFLAQLARRGALLRNYTQNVDGLEAAAGLPTSRVVHCHGSLLLDRPRCCVCGAAYPVPRLLEALQAAEVPRCTRSLRRRSVAARSGALAAAALSPRRSARLATARAPDADETAVDPAVFSGPRPSPSSTSSAHASVHHAGHAGTCGGAVKPGITFFGEKVKGQLTSRIAADVAAADLALVMGTSLSTDPVRGMVGRLPQELPIVVVNQVWPEGAKSSRPSGDRLRDGPDAPGIIFLQGDCDKVVTDLCAALGWDTPQH